MYMRNAFGAGRTRLGVSFAGLGQASDLERIRTERAQVEAEIKRLETGGVPRVGGFRPAPVPAPALPAPTPVSFGLPWGWIGAGVAALGLGYLFLRKRR